MSFDEEQKRLDRRALDPQQQIEEPKTQHHPLELARRSDGEALQLYE